MLFIFANTGDEEEKTLEFINRCSIGWNLNIVWVESVVHHNERKGSTYKVVDFKTASRNRGPFEEIIKKYGIPNQNFPHCNRELKLAPINSYVKSLGWKNYKTAIGIRSDEFDRVNQNHKK
jgi:3'-phosphoadenosine 5'-phosphosulfate sulfotransferase (PAPS reductase)/FAD synthetase